MRSFLSRFGSLIRFVFSGFDRLRFCGDPRMLNNARGLDSYLYQQQVRYDHFTRHAESLTKVFCTQTEAQARAEGVPLRHLNSPTIDKEAFALQLAQEHAPSTTGRIALLTAVELCSVYRIRKNSDGWIKPVKERGKCLHYYHYFLHPEFGLCYVRIQSWLPFTVRVGLNGRTWLYRQLQTRGVAFSQRDNLLLSVDDPALAQQLLDEQPRADWLTLLNNLVQPIQPLWSYLYDTADKPYHWMTEQSEWATDCIFHNPADLAHWYPRWLRHGIETLQCRDVLRYLGKKVPEHGYGGCTGEVKIDLRQRTEGTRLKFWYDTNSLKIYDKGGLPKMPDSATGFRIETTVNQPKAFQVYRTKEGDALDAAKAWRPMRKGVADLPRRAEISQATNNRLAESLATVADSHTLGELLKPLGQPVFADGRRRARPLNPLTGKDGTLLRALARGEFLVQGFRNRDVRLALYGEATDHQQRQRHAAAVTRQLAILRAHDVILKVPTTHRYHLSASGRRIVAGLLAAHASDIDRLTQSA
jgi:hypothetical protein